MDPISLAVFISRLRDIPGNVVVRSPLFGELAGGELEELSPRLALRAAMEEGLRGLKVVSIKNKPDGGGLARTAEGNAVYFEVV